jgi:hypothetical protein
MASLLPEEKKIIDGFDDIAKDKFYKKYLYDNVLYNKNMKEKRKNIG